MSDKEASPEVESEDEPKIEVVPDTDRDYFWTDDPDEQRRSFVFETIGHGDIDGNILIANMQSCFDWLKSGKLPEPPANKKSLKVVKDV